MARILFICGSLEEGKDGVGDYTRRLAAEAIRNGQEAAIAAIADVFKTGDARQQAWQKEEGTKVPVLRLRDALHDAADKAAMEQFIRELQPAVISLQYVPFAYHPKGLPYGLHRFLKALPFSGQWHIMFHELWVGMDRRAGIKERLWGWLQQSLIRQMFTAIQPVAVHSHTRLYLLQLQRIGITASHLPLFGNIPVNNQVPVTRSSNIEVILFGGLYPDCLFEAFTQELNTHLQKTSTKGKILFIGRNGADLNNWTKTCADQGIDFDIVGEKPVEEISYILQKGTIGLCTTPYLLAEKSGSVAAMLEHQLPVICIRNRWEPTGVKIPDGALQLPVWQYVPGNLDSILDKAREKAAAGNTGNNSVRSVCKIFIHSLKFSGN
jgi:hypothetical protein